MILKGNDALEKANKMMESLNVSQKVDSFSNVEKTFSAYNGKRYGIVKEGTKYVIKEAIVRNAKNPNDFGYIDGVQNKSKYSKNTLLEAERTLNLWNIEFSRVYGTSLLKEQEDEMPEDEESSKKTVLKVPVKKSAAPAMDAPPMPADTAADMPPMPDAEGGKGGEMPADTADADMPPMPDAEGGKGGEMPEEGGEEGDEESGVDPKKSIQKLAGKLAYELREFEGEDEDYSDIYKFAASMVASAADVSKITEKDRKSIINKVEKNLTPDEEDEISSDEEDMPEDEGMESEKKPTEEMPEAGEEAPEGIDKTLAEAFKRIQEAKKKLSDKQSKFLDKNKDGELTKKDFEMLGDSKNEAVEMSMNEGLKGKPINAWIKDFVNSKNPKFQGKSKKKRREMAIAAFLEYERSQGKDSSVTVMKGKKGKKSLKEGSDYSIMDEDYMMSEDDDFTFEMEKSKKNSKEDNLLLGGQYIDETYLDEDYMSEEYLDEVRAFGEDDDYPYGRTNLYEDDDYMSEEYLDEVRAFGEDDDYPYGITNLYEDDEPIMEITDLDEDVYFEMDYSQKKK